MGEDNTCKQIRWDLSFTNRYPLLWELSAYYFHIYIRKRMVVIFFPVFILV